MSQHAHGHAAEHSTDSHGGLAQYIYVFIALCVLTSASFFTYSDYWPFPNQPKIGWAFMMAVSCTKAMLVILFFMHVKYEASWKYVLTIPAAFMSIFLILALVPDIGMRSRWVSEEREQYMANPRVEHKAPVRHSEPRNEHSTEAPAGGEGH